MLDSREAYQLSIPPAVQLTDVTVRLGKTDVLKSICLTIEKGGM